VCDYYLGNISGVQLSQYIERYHKKIPIVLISEYGQVASEKWPVCVHSFVHKSEGQAAILASALEACERAA
jgi:hypothetical protein